MSYNISTFFLLFFFFPGYPTVAQTIAHGNKVVIILKGFLEFILRSYMVLCAVELSILVSYGMGITALVHPCKEGFENPAKRGNGNIFSM